MSCNKYEEPKTDLPPNACPNCGGTGAITVTDPEEGTFRAMCPRCNGFGVA